MGNPPKLRSFFKVHVSPGPPPSPNLTYRGAATCYPSSFNLSNKFDRRHREWSVANRFVLLLLAVVVVLLLFIHPSWGASVSPVYVVKDEPQMK